MNIALPIAGWPFATRAPGAEERLLVRLCLTRDVEEARRCWDGLTATKRKLSGAAPLRSPLRRLLPLLRHALMLCDIPLDPDVEAALKAATLWEMQRSRRIAAIIAEVAERLDGLRVAPVLLKGAALGWRDYPSPWLRHCHDLDMLVPRDEHDAAEALLCEAGAQRLSSTATHPSSRALLWPGGLPILLHGQLLGAELLGRTGRDAADRATTLILGGRSVKLLHPADCALQIAAQLADGTARDGLGWVPDLHMLTNSDRTALDAVHIGTQAATALEPVLRFVEGELGICRAAGRHA